MLTPSPNIAQSTDDTAGAVPIAPAHAPDSAQPAPLVAQGSTTAGARSLTRDVPAHPELRPSVILTPEELERQIAAVARSADMDVPTAVDALRRGELEGTLLEAQLQSLLWLRGEEP